MKPTLRVAIVAGGHGKFTAPFKTPGWECWGLNNCWGNFPNTEAQFHRWFELHRRPYLEWEYGSEEAGHFVWLRALRTLPVYVQRVDEFRDVPTARAFPFAKVAALAPDFAYYHGCSIDWMVALAIAEGARAIHLFGVEQWHSGEPPSSRACLEFWCGFARARGIDVHSTEGSTFKLAHVVYTKTPYAQDPTWMVREDQAALKSQLARFRESLRQKVEQHDGKPAGRIG